MSLLEIVLLIPLFIFILAFLITFPIFLIKQRRIAFFFYNGIIFYLRYRKLGRKEENMIYIIGDTHFGHENIIKFCNRPFLNLAEMEKELVENWNSVVTDEDTVYMLGDFDLFPNVDDMIEVAQELKGIKHLIIGNHDHHDTDAYYAAGFETVSYNPIILDEFFILSHEPQYIQGNGVYGNIFAHVHDNPMYTDVSKRSFCASVERINYTPISLEEIKRRMEES